MIKELKTKIRRRNSDDVGIFHDSRQDYITLGRICNELIEKTNELIKEVNELKREKENKL